MSFKPSPLALVLAGVLAGVLVLLVPIAAQAHVRVDGQDATQGGYGVLTFRVPTESATASTTKVQVTFPSTTPIVSVSTQPVAGWTARVSTSKLATPVKTDDGEVDSYVSAVTWTARGAAAAIKPGEFQQFNVSAGPLPKVASITLPTTQTYSDGTVVRWNERSADGTTEPEHPAPVLALAPASAGAEAQSTGPRVVAATGSSDPASWPGWTGLGLGIVAVLLAAGAFLRAGGRRPTS